jgi:PPM family protein phosphatase
MGLLTGLTFAGLSDVGLQRLANQDSYYLSPKGDLFIVADGMGGHAGGQEASQLVTAEIQRYLTAAAKVDSQRDLPVAELLEQAILSANEVVLADQSQHPERAEMGTTAVVVMLKNDQIWCAHVGDSRLYRFRALPQNLPKHQPDPAPASQLSQQPPSLVQLTHDHTWVAQAQQAGELSSEELQQHRWRHVLLQCIGRADLLSVECQRVEAAPGDWLLLCSDGLTEELDDQAIAACLSAASTCEAVVLSLIAAAKAQGGRDNITAIVLALANPSE